MTFFAHWSSGYLVYRLIKGRFGRFQSSYVLGAAVLGAMAPDIDVFFGLSIRQHHNTIFHTPVFWLGLMVAGWLFLRRLAARRLLFLFTGTALLHLFLDWFGARAAGVRLFYPWTERVYSLYPLSPQQGEVPVFPKRGCWPLYLDYCRFYLKNKVLVVSEAGLIVAGGVGWFTSKKE